MLGGGGLKAIKDFFLRRFIGSNLGPSEQNNETDPPASPPPTTTKQTLAPTPKTTKVISSIIDRNFIRNLVRQFFNEEKSTLAPPNLITIQGSVSDLNQKLFELAQKVNQIPPPLQYIGSGSGIGTVTVGGGDANVDGSRGTFGNVRVSGNSLSTTSGNLTIDSTGGTTTVSDNLTVSGAVIFSGTGSHSAAGEWNFDSGTFFVDSGTNNIGIGTTNPKSLFQVNSSTASMSYAESATISTLNLTRPTGGVARITLPGTVNGRLLFGSNLTLSANTGDSGLTVTTDTGTNNLTIFRGDTSIGTSDVVVANLKSEAYNTAAAAFNPTGIAMRSLTGLAGSEKGYFVFSTYHNGTLSDWLKIGSFNSEPYRLSLAGPANFNGIASASNFFTQPGTAASPSFSFAIDQDTGMFRRAVNVLGFSTLGVERLTIISDGNVGIGITGPGARLDIQGATGTNIFSAKNFDGTNVFILNSSGTLEHYLQTDWTSTNQGVAEFSSGTGIELTAASGIQYWMRVLPKINQSSTAGYTALLVNSTETATGSGAKFLADFQTGGTSRMVIQSGGNIGIGTTAPTALLHLGSGSGKGSRFFIVDPNTGSAASGSFGIRSSNTTGSVASISATSLTTGHVFDIVVPPSTSHSGRYLLVKDTNGLALASLGYGGRLALRRDILSHGVTSTCTGIGTPSTGCIDLAEEFPSSDTALEKGDLVAVDVDDEEIIASVRRPTKSYDQNLVGIVTTRPGIVLSNDVYIGANAENYQSPTDKTVVALVGRVPVNISFENGDIKKGDYLTSSSTPGKAMKANKEGRVIGIALESATTDSDKTQVIVFVNPHWAGKEIDASGQLADFSGLPPILGDNQAIIEAALAYLKDAVLRVKELAADVVTTKKLCLEDVCVTKDRLKQLLDKAQLSPTSNQPDISQELLPSQLPNSTPEELNVPDFSSQPSPEATAGEANPSPEPPPSESLAPEPALEPGPSSEPTLTSTHESTESTPSPSVEL